jgi:hypothetical protein
MAVNIGNLVAGESEIELSYISIPALKGDKGDTGRGISSVIKTSTVGLVDTWTITYTDGSTSSFDVTNGADGDDYVITEADYEEIADIVLENIEIPTKVSDLDNDSGFIDKDVDDLTNYYTKSETYTKTEVDNKDYITKDVNNLTNYYKTSETYNKTEVDNKISSVYKYKGTVATYADLPSSDLTVGDVYNVESTGDNYAWTGTAWDKLGGDIDLSGYQTKIDSTHKLSSDLVDDTGNTNKFVTSTDKTNWNAKYDKPSGRNTINRYDISSTNFFRKSRYSSARTSRYNRKRR